jgi:hypothetical protein
MDGVRIITNTLTAVASPKTTYDDQGRHNGNQPPNQSSTSGGVRTVSVIYRNIKQ